MTTAAEWSPARRSTPRTPHAGHRLQRDHDSRRRRAGLCRAGVHHHAHPADPSRAGAQETPDPDGAAAPGQPGPDVSVDGGIPRGDGGGGDDACRGLRTERERSWAVPSEHAFGSPPPSLRAGEALDGAGRCAGGDAGRDEVRARHRSGSGAGRSREVGADADAVPRVDRCLRKADDDRNPPPGGRRASGAGAAPRAYSWAADANADDRSGGARWRGLRAGDGWAADGSGPRSCQLCPDGTGTGDAGWASRGRPP